MSAQVVIGRERFLLRRLIAPGLALGTSLRNKRRAIFALTGQGWALDRERTTALRLGQPLDRVALAGNRPAGYSTEREMTPEGGGAS